MYHNYAQLLNDIDKICDNHITNNSYCVLNFFRDDISHYKMIYQKACSINNNTHINDTEKIKRMIDFLLSQYNTNKNLMLGFKDVINKCLNISQQEWKEYHSTINEHAKASFDFQYYSGQILLFNAASLAGSLKLRDPIEQRIHNTKQIISSKP